LAFSEIRRLEKDFNSQGSHFEDEITCLKEYVKYLEERKGHRKHYNKNDDCKEVSETTHNEHRGKLSECEETEKEADYSMLEPDENLEESDPCLFNTGSTDVKVDSVDDDASLPVPTKEQKKSKSLPENKRSKKCLRKLSSKKGTNSSESASEVDDLHPSADSGVSGDKEGLEQKLTRSTETSLSNDKMEKEKMESEDVAGTDAEVPESDSDFKGNSKGGKEEIKVKKTRKKKRGVSLKDSDRNSPDQMPEADVKQPEEITHTKKGKKKRSLDKGEFKEDFQTEIPGDEIIQLDTGIKTKGKKKIDSPVQERPEVKPNKKLSRTKESKSSSEDMPNTIEEEMVTGQPEPMETSQKQPRASTAGGMSSKNVKSSKKELTTTGENDEQLGDMSFLINVNSRIALFVADASQEECELQPMTARERNDVYKVTHLYKLRARIGTKTENNLTTVRLSKQADTRMPKPGRVDSLLSELSIAASKVAFRESPKNQEKRKFSAVTEGDDQTVAEDGLDQAAPPKKKLTKLSRSNKP